MNNVVLGLDIGFRTTGWVVASVEKGDYRVKAHGHIKTVRADRKSNIKVSVDDFNNLCYIFRELKKVAEEYAVSGVMAELPTGGAKSASALKAMAISSAVVACFIEQLQLPYELCGPIDNKKGLCGKNSASKEEMQDACVAMYPDSGWPEKKTITRGKNKGGTKYPDYFEHIADAMGACVACKHTTTFRVLDKQTANSRRAV